MRVTLINNGTKEPEKLYDLLCGHDVTSLTLEDALRALDIPADLIVLSGSSRFPIAYHPHEVSAEIELIQKTDTPIIGICYGAELLAVAYGGTLRDMGEKTHGVMSIAATADPELFSGRTSFDAYEAHRWTIDTLPEELVVLAQSETGPEVIRHQTKMQYGFQFHPEKFCDETFGDEVFTTLLARLSSSTELS